MSSFTVMKWMLYLLCICLILSLMFALMTPIYVGVVTFKGFVMGVYRWVKSWF
jgi:hypothetical protein